MAPVVSVRCFLSSKTQIGKLKFIPFVRYIEIFQEMWTCSKNPDLPFWELVQGSELPQFQCTYLDWMGTYVKRNDSFYLSTNKTIIHELPGLFHRKKSKSSVK